MNAYKPLNYVSILFVRNHTRAFEISVPSPLKVSVVGTVKTFGTIHIIWNCHLTAGQDLSLSVTPAVKTYKPKVVSRIIDFKLYYLASDSDLHWSMSLHHLHVLSKCFGIARFFILRKRSTLVISLSIYHCPYDSHSRTVSIITETIIYHDKYIYYLSYFLFLIIPCNVSLPVPSPLTHFHYS